MAKDFLGKELRVGDNVVFMEIKYRNFKKAVITKLTPQKAYISFENHYGWEREVLQFHNQLIRIF